MSFGEKKAGLSLIEILISIGLVIILVFILNAILIGKTLEDKGERTTRAYALAQEEMEKLLNRGVANLTNTTSAAFIDVLYHEGLAEVRTDALSQSSPNLLDITSTSGLTTTVTGTVVLPKNTYADFTIDTRLMLRTGSPSGSGKGILFRAKDSKNGYLVTLTDSAIRLKKLVNGVETTLYSGAYFVIVDTWDRVELIVTGSSIELRLNSISQFTTTDTTYTEGYLAFVGTDGAYIAVDDASVTDTTGTQTWNFDTLSAGPLRGEWQRIALQDLPSGSGSIDIANYLSSSAIKDIAVRVSWNEKGATKTVTLQSLLTN